MSHKQKILKGSASNLLRVLVSALVALVLPPFLVHRMSAAEYSAWVLILQLSAYVNLLDLGLQTAIGKFVAEYDAIDNLEASGRILSSSFAILCLAALIGAAIIGVITWRLPQLFHQMPSALVGSVRLGLLSVGLSLCLALPFNAFLATFTGLQRYLFPAVLSVMAKLLSTTAIVVLLIMHGSIVKLAVLMAGFNVATAIAQFVGWRIYARHRVNFSFKYIDRGYGRMLAKYGSILSIWTFSGLFISGLDTVIVGHFDYVNTGFYAIGSSVTNFMLLIVGSLFGPLLPAVSSLQPGSTPRQVGEITVRATRYCSLLLFLIALPVFWGAYPLLTAWVGRDYANHSTLLLEVLLLGNIVRQFAYPYALVVVATGKQHLATISSVAEAIVNFSISVILVQKIGAVGVAIGTLAGAFVSVAVHILLSMHLTQSTMLISRKKFILNGILRPFLCVIPSIFLVFFWKQYALVPAAPGIIALWALCTLGTAWLTGLDSKEHREFIGVFSHLLYWFNR